MASLAERLGYAPDAKLLVVNCDDLGSTRSANVAVYDALRNGVATSASLMVPCPWARDAAAQYRGEDVGVHLTLNSEWETYRWGPITQSSSLLDGDGGFPRTVEDTWDHADLDEVRRECRAQIERAIMWGFDVSHLDSHMGTLQMRADFFDVYLELAVDFRLPLRFEDPIHIAVKIIFRDRSMVHFSLRIGTTFVDVVSTVPSISCCSRSRARDSRDITVPTGMFSTFAASA